MAIKVGTLQVDLIANTASFTGPLDKGAQQARKSAKDIQDGFNSMDLSEARGGIMVLGEEIGVHLPRHVQSFVAELPGVGAAMSAAFPILAVVAIGVAIGELIEKHEKLAIALQKAAAEEAGLKIKTGDQTASIELQNLRLEDQIAKIEGRPSKNQLRESLIEARTAADQLADSLGKDIAKGIEVLSDQTGGWEKFKTNLKSAFTDTDGTSTANASMENVISTLDEVNNARLKLAGAQSEQQVKTGVLELSAAYAGLKSSAETALSSVKEKTPEDQKAINALNEIVIASTASMRGMAQEVKQIDLKRVADEAQKMQEAIALSDKQFAETKKASDAASQSVIADYQNQYAQQKISAEALTALKDIELNKQYTAERSHLEQVKALEAGRPALQALTEKQIEALDSTHKAKLLENDTTLIKEEQKLLSDQTREIMSDAEKQNAARLKAANEAIAFYEKQQNGVQKISTLTKELDDQDAIHNQKMAIATGLLTQQQATQQTLLTLETNKAKEVEEINKRLNEQFDLVQKLDAATNGGTTGTDDQKAQYQKAVLDWQQYQTQKLQILKMFNAQIDAANLALANNEHSQWNKLLNDWSQVSTRISQLGRQMFDGLSSSLANYVVTGQGGFKNLAVSALESLTKIEIQHLIGFALQKTLADKLKMIDAKRAFHGAYAATSDIPVIGPVLAPVAGAAAFAAVMAFEKGGIVPEDAYALVHHNEMVLPAPISTFIMNAASSGSGAGGSQSHFVFAPTIQAVDATGVDSMLTKHADIFHRHVRNHMRKMNFA